MRNAAWMVMMIAASGPAAYAGRTVTVCSEAAAPGGPSIPTAHMMATEMFARIGVKLEWRGRSHCPAGALQISLSTRTPAELLPGALAYALPNEGTHIVVFIDRVRTVVKGERIATVVLAHVLAHEITHILQGECRHSASGLMKARWDGSDYATMDSEPLAFSPEDVAMIYSGLVRRGEKLSGLGD